MFIAKRLELGAWEVLQADGTSLASLRYPKFLWHTKGTLSESGGDPFVINPVMEMDGERYFFSRELINPQEFTPHYRIVGGSEAHPGLIEADHPPGLTLGLVYREVAYQLRRESRWSYRYTLLRDATALARFRDTTPFFTFSARREYALETLEDLPAQLVCLSFFLTALCGGA